MRDVSVTEKDDIDIFKGAAWQDANGLIVRVMAVVDGYVMWRYKGCSPGLLMVKDFRGRFSRSPGFNK